MTRDNEKEEMMRILAENLISAEEYEFKGSSIIEVTEIISENGYDVSWEPIGGIENNLSMVDQTDDGMQALSELISNSEDAYLMLDNNSKDISREDAMVDQENNILLQFSGSVGKGKGSSEFSIAVLDEGVGQRQESFEESFFSNTFDTGKTKKEYDFLNGMFGQGSLAPLPFCKNGCKFVMSSHYENSQNWSWSITRYNQEKTQYEYLLVDGEVPKFEGCFSAPNIPKISHGTITKLYSYDIASPSKVTDTAFMRKLEKNYYDSTYPIVLQDDRRSDGRRYLKRTSGLKQTVKNSEAFQECIQKEVEVDEIGNIEVEVFVPHSPEERQELYENDEIKKEDTGKYIGNVFTGVDRDGILFVHNGQTHHSVSNSYLNSECGLDNISENTLVVVDCSEIDIHLSKIFKADRTKMKSVDLSNKLKNNVFEVIRNTDELQKINSDRNKYEYNSSPIESINIKNIGVEQVGIKVQEDSEFILEVDVEAPEDYWKKDNVSIELFGYNQEFDVQEINDNNIGIVMNPEFGLEEKINFKFALVDEKYDYTESELIILEKDSSVVDNSDEDIVDYESESFDINETKQRFKDNVDEDVDLNQSWRAKSGDCFERWVKNKLQENVSQKSISLESEIDQELKEQLNINSILPDADIVVHKEGEIHSIVSCKTTLRERVGQTIMWKTIFEKYDKDISYYLATTDKDEELSKGKKWKKMVEQELDGAYITNGEIPESSSIKEFEKIYEEV